MAETLDALMILVCVIALVILLAFVVYTWVKWHRQQTSSASNVPPPSSIEHSAGLRPVAHFQKGYLNEIGRESPNLSGSRTFLNEDVLKQKPYSENGSAPPEFQTKDVVYHVNAEHNPKELQSGDIVYHANGPYGSAKNIPAANAVDAGNVAIKYEEPSGKRRWSESATLSGDHEKVEVSHRKNTYL